MILTIDIFRYLTQFLDIKTFINLTSTCRNLRRLYYESSIWEKLLNRDFKYNSHPTFDADRYKICLRRKNLNIVGDDVAKLVQSLPSVFGKGLIYADFDEKVVDMFNLFNWDLIHYDIKTNNNRPIIHKSTLFVMILSSVVFSQYLGGGNNTLELIKINLIFDPHYEVEDIDKDLEDKIIKKSMEVLGCIFSCAKMIEIKEDLDKPIDSDIFNKMKQLPNYEAAKLKWRQYGFN